jgi:hypothetical protein
MKYAKIKSRKTVRGTRYSYEYKDIMAGEKVRWPFQCTGFWLTKAEAQRAVEINGGIVVKTWDEAMAHANVYSMDGYYHTPVGACPCPSAWCDRSARALHLAIADIDAKLGRS